MLKSKQKSNFKNLKKLKDKIKKQKGDIVKLRKKAKKDGNEEQRSVQSSTRLLYSLYKDLGDFEESIFEDSKIEEKRYMENFLHKMKPVLKEELKFFKICDSSSSLIDQVDQILFPQANHTTEEKIQVEADIKDPMVGKMPDLVQRSKSMQEPSMGSRSGSFLSLSSFASYTFREENSFRDRRHEAGQCFTTVKRSPSQHNNYMLSLDRRRELRRKYDVKNRPALAPLPPLPPPRSNSSLSNKEGSLTDLRQKLDMISGFTLDKSQDNFMQEDDDNNALEPRSAYTEDNTMRELHNKLLSLTYNQPESVISQNVEDDIQREEDRIQVVRSNSFIEQSQGSKLQISR